MALRFTVLVMASALVAASTVPEAEQPKAKQPERARESDIAVAIFRLGIEGAIKEALQEIVDKLHVRTDDEKKLLAICLAEKSNGSAATVSIVLLRPSRSASAPRRYAVSNPEQRFTLRLTKMQSNRIKVPTAVVTYSAVNGEDVLVNEKVLTFVNGKWRQEVVKR